MVKSGAAACGAGKCYKVGASDGTQMEVDGDYDEDFIDRIALRAAEKAAECVAERAAEAAAEKVMARYESRIMNKVGEKLQESETRMLKALDDSFEQWFETRSDAPSVA